MRLASAVFLGYNQYWPGGSMFFVVLCPGAPEGSTDSTSSDFKASQRTGPQLKVSSDRLGKAGNRACDPWFTRHSFIHYTTAALFLKKITTPGYVFVTLPTQRADINQSQGRLRPSLLLKFVLFICIKTG